MIALSLSGDENRLRLQTERVISLARAALALGGLLAVYLDAAEPARFASQVTGGLVVYLVLSLAIVAGLRTLDSVSPTLTAWLYGLDVTCAGVLTTFTMGPESPLFVFFWFVVLTAAFRSGVRGAIGAALLLFAILVVQWAALAGLDPAAPPSLNVIVVRATFLAVMAFLLGYLAQNERDLRTGAVAVARVLGRARDERTFAAGLQAGLEEVATLFDASRVVMVLEGPDISRQCWLLKRTAGHESSTHLASAGALQQDAYFFPVPDDVRAWHCRSVTGGGDPEYAAVGADGERVRTLVDVPRQFWQAMGGDRVLAAVDRSGDQWHARIFISSASASTPHALAQVLHTVMQRLAPALENLLLLGHKATEAERGRLARELHDRVLQSLIGLEMQLTAAERRDMPRDQLLERVREIHGILRSEIGNVRDLMHDLRPVEISGQQLAVYLSDLTERFQRETGIHTSFVSNAPSIGLAPRHCGSLARIVQEALVNIRKHSGARHAMVRLEGRGEAVALTIEDDGTGFGFSGRLDDEQLWTQHRGPLVIKERARAIGASLTLESTPGEGSRLNLVIPYAV